MVRVLNYINYVQFINGDDLSARGFIEMMVKESLPTNIYVLCPIMDLQCFK